MATASCSADACAHLPSSSGQDQTADKRRSLASELTLEQTQGLKCGVPVAVSVAAASSTAVEHAAVNAEQSIPEDSSGTPLLNAEMPVPDVCLQERTLLQESVGGGAETGPAEVAAPCKAWSGGSGALSTAHKPSSSSLGEHRTRVSVAGAFALLVTAYLQTQIPP